MNNKNIIETIKEAKRDLYNYDNIYVEDIETADSTLHFEKNDRENRIYIIYSAVRNDDETISNYVSFGIKEFMLKKIDNILENGILQVINAMIAYAC